MNVERDRFPPVLNLPETVRLEETAQPDAFVFDVEATDADKRVREVIHFRGVNLVHVMLVSRH